MILMVESRLEHSNYSVSSYAFYSGFDAVVIGARLRAALSVRGSPADACAATTIGQTRGLPARTTP